MTESELNSDYNSSARVKGPIERWGTKGGGAPPRSIRGVAYTDLENWPYIIVHTHLQILCLNS